MLIRRAGHHRKPTQSLTGHEAIVKKELNLGCSIGSTVTPGKFLFLGYGRRDGAGQRSGRHCVFRRKSCRREGLLPRQGRRSQAVRDTSCLLQAGRGGMQGCWGHTLLQLHVQYRHSHEPGHRPPKSFFGMIYLILRLVSVLFASLPFPGAPAHTGLWMQPAPSVLQVLLPIPQTAT